MEQLMEFLTPAMKGILNNPLVHWVFAIFVLVLFYDIIRRSMIRSPVDKAILRMLRYAKQQDLRHTWSTFSPSLRETLQDKRRKYLRERGIFGLKYLEFFINTHPKAFNSRYIIQSRHVVKETRAETEMVMVHLKRSGRKGGLTVWVTREGGITAPWLVHELYIHASQKEELGYSLTGKSMSTRDMR